ncbi:very short patch repair endonuclease [Winogradskyella alexanderae]|uniref:Very short patch repair endonuclease n=1 Tax=Winogradskyella alexanderae TaxID=2877123 RepID=A0ABS7XNC3_9FLAO|nr:very short patch repair endonuclease [Winogradskyella alexanderae]MCA0131503.1 very short patch repair endonuclease [Winogradskyella alexanderae]
MSYTQEKIKVPRFCEEAGFYTSEKRSKMMSKIRGTNSKPELVFRSALWKKGVRYRINNKQLPGKPDVSIKKYKLAIFIDGEYWHGYNWDERKPKVKTNRRFWIPKIERNMQRDKEVTQQLNDLGYTVFRFWAHEVKDRLNTCLNDVMLYLYMEGLKN